MIERFDPKARYASQLHGEVVREAAASDDVPEAAWAEEPAEEEAPVDGGGVIEGPGKKPLPKGARRAAWLVSMVVMGAVLGFVIVGVLRFVNDPVEAATTRRGVVKPPTFKTRSQYCSRARRSNSS